MKKIFVILIALTFSSPLFAKSVAKTIDELMVGEHRSEASIERNQYRNPKETLAFFGLKKQMTVVEVWPGSGWYSEIIAPVVRQRGRYYSAGFVLDENSPPWRKTMVERYINKIQGKPDLYGFVFFTELGQGKNDIAPAGSANMVLTFRNVHNWMKDGYADEVFEGMFKALKPGGTLGVVEHRAKPGTSIEDMIRSGYVTEAHVIALAEKAGFELVARSEINANPKDTANHPAGVWSLPPTLRLQDQDREKYLAIGESDRMTLKFKKPGRTPFFKKILKQR